MIQVFHQPLHDNTTAAVMNCIFIVLCITCIYCDKDRFVSWHKQNIVVLSHLICSFSGPQRSALSFDS